MTAPLQLAVVGHTNTGKTSLARTLMRDASFGEVDNAPGTTRHVEGVRLHIDGQLPIDWFDTPGMEDSVALRDYVETLTGSERLDGPAQIRRFLDSPEAQRRFEQEARVLSKVLLCDAALYVIDARDPVLAKHRDELALLADCGRPILPVLNFTHAPGHRADAWRQAMARLGLHVQAEFDTVVPALDGEAQLYERLAVLLHAHHGTLSGLAAALGRQRHVRHHDACRLLAELLIDAAALRITCAPDDDAVREAGELLRDQLRQREQQFVDALLALYRFRAGDVITDDFPLTGTRWGMDLFHPQALKDMGIQVGTGAAAGAAAGAAIDLMTAGLSLGTGTLVGAAAGGAWTGVERLGKRLAGRLRGQRELTVEDPFLQLLAQRGQTLITALDRRGHAATAPMTLRHDGQPAWRDGSALSVLKEARSRPEWSTLSPAYDADARRRVCVRTLADALSARAS